MSNDDDTVHYIIFLPNDDVELESNVHAFLCNASMHYMWNNEALLFSRTNSSPNCLRGSTKYGDCIEDEWFIVSLLFELSKQFESLVIRMWDGDGDFLLIEAADVLPKWVHREDMRNRVFIAKGVAQFIPKKPICSDANVLAAWPTTELNSLELNIDLVRRFSQFTKAPQSVQKVIAKRISKFPNDLLDDHHYCHLMLPPTVAELIRSYPFIIGQAANAFCSRSPTDSKTLRAMKQFPPKELVLCGATLTKLVYAKLLHQKFRPDKASGFDVVGQRDAMFKPKDIGMKLACGFEILASRNEKGLSVDTDDESWINFAKCLKCAPEQSPRENGSSGVTSSDAMMLPKVYFVHNVEKSTLPDDGNLVLDLVDSLSVDVAQLKQDAANLPVQNDDSWLDVSMEQLDSILASKFGTFTDGKATNFSEKINDFLNQETNVFDGVDCTEHAYHDNDSGESSSDGAANAYSDEESGGDGDGEPSQFMLDYMKKMDAELKNTNVKKLANLSMNNGGSSNTATAGGATATGSTVKSPKAKSSSSRNAPPVDEKDPDFDESDNFDEDGMIGNLMESLRAEMGHSGPASQLLRNLTNGGPKAPIVDLDDDNL